MRRNVDGINTCFSFASMRVLTNNFNPDGVARKGRRPLGIIDFPQIRVLSAGRHMQRERRVNLWVF
ncbi:hypothetical protein SDC9_147882 [bioreactor metagenome]|uniref:Uncharacterized protein n=1 Tax=bioreactor metagenome TaxID=1076179 RepID=A0A645EGW8_9ZZZZ